VGELLAVSTTDVTSTIGGTGATAASEADKAGTSIAPATEEEGGNLCMADPLPTLDPQAAEAGGARVEDDAHRCLYCRMDLPGPTTSMGARTDYSVGPWDYPACATRHLKAWSTRTAKE
jgi:hypothetical protein